MRRRDFITLVGNAAAILPFKAYAQQANKLPKVCSLQSSRNENFDAFIEGLREAGYIDHQNVEMEHRFYQGAMDRMEGFANELVGLECNVILATAPYAIRALTRATNVIPIVGVDLESDPVENGWAKSLARPGGNVTGVFLDLPGLGGKQIEVLRDAVPTLSSLAVLWDASIGTVQFRATQAAADEAKIMLQSLPIRSVSDIKDVFEHASNAQVHGLVVLSSPLIFNQLSHVADLALKARLPTISLFTSLPRVGGLIAYGPSLLSMQKQSATYIARVLSGAKVGELPIERPSKFELVINLKTASALGLTIPPRLLVRADEVIE
jgi:putative ABC transport system substrate-binding protein